MSQTRYPMMIHTGTGLQAHCPNIRHPPTEEEEQHFQPALVPEATAPTFCQVSPHSAAELAMGKAPTKASVWAKVSSLALASVWAKASESESVLRFRWGKQDHTICMSRGTLSGTFQFDTREATRKAPGTMFGRPHTHRGGMHALPKRRGERVVSKTNASCRHVLSPPFALHHTQKSSFFGKTRSLFRADFGEEAARKLRLISSVEVLRGNQMAPRGLGDADPGRIHVLMTRGIPVKHGSKKVPQKAPKHAGGAGGAGGAGLSRASAPKRERTAKHKVRVFKT